eukprot:616269-Pleurochrysis_carterae.AAC.1
MALLLPSQVAHRRPVGGHGALALRPCAQLLPRRLHDAIPAHVILRRQSGRLAWRAVLRISEAKRSLSLVSTEVAFQADMRLDRSLLASEVTSLKVALTSLKTALAAERKRFDSAAAAVAAAVTAVAPPPPFTA